MAANEMMSDWSRLWFRNLVHHELRGVNCRDVMTGLFRIMDVKCVILIWMRMLVGISTLLIFALYGMCILLFPRLWTSHFPVELVIN